MKLFKRNLPLETFKVYYKKNGGGLWCGMDRKTWAKDSDITTDVKAFLTEIKNGYWLTLAEFGCGPIPIEHSSDWFVEFGAWNFSVLTKTYLFLQSAGGRELYYNDELLNAVTATIGSYLAHVPKRVNKKVLNILGDPLFHNLDEAAIGNAYWRMGCLVEQGVT